MAPAVDEGFGALRGEAEVHDLGDASGENLDRMGTLGAVERGGKDEIMEEVEEEDVLVTGEEGEVGSVVAVVGVVMEAAAKKRGQVRQGHLFPLFHH